MSWKKWKKFVIKIAVENKTVQRGQPKKIYTHTEQATTNVTRT